METKLLNEGGFGDLSFAGILLLFLVGGGEGRMR